MAWLVATVGFAAGLMIPVGVLTSTASALIVTFFGLVAAGIFPAVSLLVANTLSGGQSVANLLKLKHELDVIVDRMLHLLAILGLGAVAIIIIELDVSLALPSIGSIDLPVAVAELPERILQAIAFGALVAVADRTRLIFSAFKLVMKARYELALSDSRKRLAQSSPSRQDIASSFRTPENFGARPKNDESGVSGEE